MICIPIICSLHGLNHQIIEKNLRWPASDIWVDRRRSILLWKNSQKHKYTSTTPNDYKCKKTLQNTIKNTNKRIQQESTCGALNIFADLGKGKERENSIPENMGMGIRGFDSREWPRTGIPAHPCSVVSQHSRVCRSIHFEESSISVSPRY